MPPSRRSSDQVHRVDCIPIAQHTGAKALRDRTYRDGITNKLEPARGARGGRGCGRVAVPGQAAVVVDGWCGAEPAVRREGDDGHVLAAGACHRNSKPQSNRQCMIILPCTLVSQGPC